MLTPFAMRYFFGVRKSSVRNQPPKSTGEPERFCNSMVSVGGGGSLWVNTSLMTICGKVGAAPSPAPGVPWSAPLARQLAARPQVFAAAFSLTMISEKPKPSVRGYQSSS